MNRPLLAPSAEENELRVVSVLSCPGSPNGGPSTEHLSSGACEDRSVAVVAVRFSENPVLWERIGGLSAEVWPEYNRHGDVLNQFWRRLYEVFPDYQFVLYDQDIDEVLAEAHTIPVAWDGTVEDLGPGIDASIVAGFELHAKGGTASALCALAAEIPRRNRDRKDRYPLTPIERYVAWVRENGQPFDPWLRVHTRMGGEITAPIPESMRITGTVADWEAWTGIAYPESGEYVFPGGLTTVSIGRESDFGSYWEPNVWIVHALSE
jgi:hypothetical protein